MSSVESPTVTIEGAYGVVQAYADRRVYTSPEFQKLERDLKVDTHPIRSDYLEDGIAQFVRRFHLIRELQDPAQREKFRKDAEEEGISNPTFHILLSYDNESDPGGIDALRVCRDIDMKYIVQESYDPFDNDTPSKQGRAEATGAAQDIMINYYEAELVRLGIRMQNSPK